MEKVKYENGIHEISNDEYHASQGVSRSALMKLKKSPYHYWYEYESGLYQRSEPSDALILGDVVHTLVLEPHLYDKRYIISPKFDRRTTAGKADYAAFQELAMGKVVLSQDIAAQAAGIAGMVNKNEIAADLLRDCVVESSIYFNHKPSGIQLKARPDAMLGSVVIDLKTTVDASYRGMQSSAYKYGYFLQSGFICEALKSIGIEMEKFIIVAVEKTPPYAVGIYILDQEAIDYGVNQLNELMVVMDSCINKDEWPSYPIQNLSIPHFAKYDLSIDADSYE